MRAVDRDIELVVEMQQMLLDGCICDHELGRHLAHSRRLGEDTVAKGRTAERYYNVTLATRQFRELVAHRYDLTWE